MSDSIHLTCPACDKRLRVKPDLAGRRIRCPNKACGKPIDIPDDSDDDADQPAGRPLWPWLVAGGTVVAVVATVGVLALSRGGKPAPPPPTNDPPVAQAKPAPAEPVREPEPAKAERTKTEPAVPIELPGAAGDRVAYLNKPAELRAVYLSATEKLPKGGPEAAWSTYVPSGTKKLFVGVVFRQEPADARKIEIRVRSAAGETKVEEGVPDWLSFNGTTYVRFLTLTAPDAGWPDGAYQAEVRVNDKAVALLNWSLTKEPTPVVKADPPKPAELPVDKDLTWAEAKGWDRYNGTRVAWPAFPKSLRDDLLIVAERKQDQADNQYLPHLYCIYVGSTDAASLGLFVDLMKADELVVTGTIAGQETLEYEFGIPPDPKKKYRITVPVLVNPVIRSKSGGYVFGRSFDPVKWPRVRPKDDRKLTGIDSPLATAIANREPLVVPGQFWVPNVAVAPDGKTLAVLDTVRQADRRTGVLAVLDARTGAERGKYPLPRFGYCLAYSPDGKTVAVGAEHAGDKAVNPAAECPIFLVDVTTGKTTTLPGHNTTWMMGTDCLAFTADGTILASSARGDAVRIWDVATGSEKKAIKMETFQWGRGISPDGKWALVGQTDQLRLINVEPGAPGPQFQHPDWRVATFAPAGPVLVTSAYKEPDLRVWDTATGTQKARVALREPLPAEPVFSPDGKYLYFQTGPLESAGRKADLWVWDLTTNPPVLLTTVADESGGRLAISGDGTSLAMTSHRTTSGKVRVWSIAAGAAAAPTPMSKPPARPAEDELLMMSSGPKDASLSPVLRYLGGDLAKALADGNRLVDTTKTDAAVRVDPKDPKLGTIEWRGYEWRRNGVADVVNFGKPAIPLAVRRKTPTTTDWELAPEGVETVKMKLMKK